MASSELWEGKEHETSSSSFSPFLFLLILESETPFDEAAAEALRNASENMSEK